MSSQKPLEENRILKLAEKIYCLTDGMCQVGPGPYGFGTSNANPAEIGLCISLEESPVRDDVLFPGEVEGYEMSICAFYKKDQRIVSQKEIPGLMESKNAATRKIVSALQELSKESQYVTTKEYKAAFKELVDREFEQIYGNGSDGQAEVQEEESVLAENTGIQMDM